jgi:hypothetical protein
MLVNVRLCGRLSAAMALSLLHLACESRWRAASVLDGGALCPNDLPASCPANVPSFSQTIQPLMQSECGTCHSPGGSAPDRSFSSYADGYAQRSAFLDQVYACKMPPAGAVEGLSKESRDLILTWLVCNAPDN